MIKIKNKAEKIQKIAAMRRGVAVNMLEHIMALPWHKRLQWSYKILFKTLKVK